VREVSKPHPTLSKGEGFKKVLSFGEDLGEANKAIAKINYPPNQLNQPFTTFLINYSLSLAKKNNE